MSGVNGFLPPLHRRAHRALLDAVLTNGVIPSPTDLAGIIGVPAAEVAASLDALALADYIGQSASGEVTCLYPFSAVPTAHLVAIHDAHRHAMCSIDALGIAAMLGQAVRVTGRCAACGKAIHIDVEPGRIVTAEPSETVVVARRSGDEPACETCCPGTLFACGPAHGRAVVGRSPQSELVPLVEALGHAESIFSGFLAATLPAHRPRSEATSTRLRT